MRIIAVISASLATLISSAPVAAAPAACDQSPLIVENVRRFNAGENENIAIVDGRIEWIGAVGAEPEKYANARRFDGGGAIALPGLIDSHVHFEALPAAKHLQSQLNVASEIYPVTMRQTLASGVTLARVHLSALDDMALLKTIADDNCFPAPRIVLSGPGLRGGAPDLDARLMRGVSNAEDLTVKINELVDRGAEWIAIHGPSAFDLAERDAIRGAIANHDIKLMIEGDSFHDFEAALDLAATSIEYLNRTDAPAYPNAILTAVRKREAPLYVSAPIGYYQRSAEYADAEDKTLKQSLFDFVPSPLETEMRIAFPSAFERDQYIARAITAFPTMAHKFEQLRSVGVRMVVGSDSGSLGQFHHDAIWAEFAAWRAFGASTKEVIDGATRVPAEMLGRADIGVLAHGAHGDVVLVNANFEIDGFRRETVSAVIKGGVIFVEDGEWRGPGADDMAARVNEYKKR